MVNLIDELAAARVSNDLGDGSSQPVPVAVRAVAGIYSAVLSVVHLYERLARRDSRPNG